MKSMGNIWYHGTLEQGITQFKILSHFGNRFSASAAAARRNYLLKNNNDRIYYEAEIRLFESEILTIPDWGKNDSIALCLVLKEYFESIDLSLMNKFEAIRLEGIRLKNEGKFILGSLNDEVATELAKLGYKALAYKNDVEKTERGEISLCVIDPSIISVKSVGIFTDQENLAATDFITNLYKDIHRSNKN